jgi:flagellar protein FliL
MAADDKKSKDGEKEAPAKGGLFANKKLLIMIVLPVLLLAGGGGYWFFGTGTEEEPPPEPGEVIVMDPITVNLAGGHYLKFGLALQAILDVHEAPDGSKAMDLAISTLSNRDMSELSTSEQREKVKHELEEKVKHAYHDEVMTIYFTQFVME